MGKATRRPWWQKASQPHIVCGGDPLEPFTVANCWSGPFAPTIEVARANAALIVAASAADDLLVNAKLTLAALRVAIDNCTWAQGFHLVAAEQAAEQMRAAIARAEGE